MTEPTSSQPLSPRNAAALSAIVALRGPDGWTRELRWRLALEAGLDRSAWQRAAASLVAQQLVEALVVGAGNQRATIYRLTAAGEASHHRATTEPPTEPARVANRATTGPLSFSSSCSNSSEAKEEETKDTGATESRPGHQIEPPTEPPIAMVLAEALAVIRAQHELIARLADRDLKPANVIADPHPDLKECGCGKAMERAKSKHGPFDRCPDWKRCTHWRDRNKARSEAPDLSGGAREAKRQLYDAMSQKKQEDVEGKPSELDDPDRAARLAKITALARAKALPAQSKRPARATMEQTA